jgi:uncharacterized protein
MDRFVMPGIPGELEWLHPPERHHVAGDGSLAVVATGSTDWFADPASAVVVDTAPVALFTPPSGDFTLRARVSVAFASTFDAGVIQIRERDGLWAKLCLEYSPAREPMVVSVVTRGVSDDCNGPVVQGDHVHLRVARTGTAWAFHNSLDGRRWQLVRHFRLGAGAVLIGFSAQSPTGQGCTAVFSEIACHAGTVADIRGGG